VVARALEAPDAAERRRATRLTATLGDPILDRRLAPRLVDPDPTVRALAACALAPEVELAAPLCAAALDEPDPEARLAALDGVTALRDAAERVLGRARDPDARVRARAAERLGALKPDGAHAAVEALLADGDAGVRAAALGACAALGGPGALGAVEHALGDAALGVRLAALQALVRLSDDAARLTALAGGPDAFVALRAAVQLARRGQPGATLLRARDAVARAAGDRRWELRAAAMNAAGELGAAGLAPARAALRDPAPEVRLAAASVLSRSDDAGALAAARAALVSALSTPLGLEAAAELTRLGDARGAAALDAGARAADPSLRRRAIALLGSVAGSTEPLRRALADADAGVRLGAAEALLRRALQPQLR
jgi:HEAT repeat protein